MDFAHGQDKIGIWADLGFANFDTNKNGVLDNADVGVTVANGNTTLDFSGHGSPTTLTVIGVTALGSGDFVDVF